MHHRTITLFIVFGVLNLCLFRISKLQKAGLVDTYEESFHVHQEGEFLMRSTICFLLVTTFNDKLPHFYYCGSGRLHKT